MVALGSGPERCATGEEELEFKEAEEEEDKKDNLIIMESYEQRKR